MYNQKKKTYPQLKLVRQERSLLYWVNNGLFAQLSGYRTQFGGKNIICSTIKKMNEQ